VAAPLASRDAHAREARRAISMPTSEQSHGAMPWSGATPATSTARRILSVIHASLRHARHGHIVSPFRAILVWFYHCHANRQYQSSTLVPRELRADAWFAAQFECPRRDLFKTPLLPEYYACTGGIVFALKHAAREEICRDASARCSTRPFIKNGARPRKDEGGVTG